MKLTIGIITTGTIKTRTMASVVKFVKTRPDINFVIWEGCNVHQSRTNIVREAIKNGSTHLLFIDSDMVFEPEAVEKIIQYDKDIVGVSYNMRKLPLTSTIKIHDENGVQSFTPTKDLFECYAVATGFMLIKMSVFEKIKTPWFAFEFDENGDMKVGSDVWFCKQAREAGFKIWCDPTTKVGHIGDFTY